MSDGGPEANCAWSIPDWQSQTPVAPLQRHVDAFRQHFQPRDVQTVTVLTIPARPDRGDWALMRVVLRALVKGGKRGVVCDFGRVERGGDDVEPLGYIVVCHRELSMAGAAFCWLRALDYVQEWKNSGAMTPPADNFETEGEAIRYVLEKLAAST